MSDDIVVVDNGQTYETSESAIIAKNEADRAEQWAKYSEEKANLADERAIDAAESSDAAAQAATAAIEAKQYAEEAITDENLIPVATDLKATPSNIKIVATNIDDVVMVSGIKDDVVIVSENISDVMTVADNIADVNNVASNITDVKAAISSADSALASKNSAAQSETNAQIWAEGKDPQVTGLGGTHSAKEWAELAGSFVDVQSASETTFGIVKLSTTAEAKDGFDDNTAITPLKLAQVVADNVGRGIQLGFTGTLEGNVLTFETTDPSPYTLRHNYDYEIDLLFQAVDILSDDVEVVIKNGEDYINIVNVLHDDPTTHITVGDIRQLMKYNDVSGWRWVFMARYAVTANGNKVFIMPSTVVSVDESKIKRIAYEQVRQVDCSGETTVNLQDTDEIIYLPVSSDATITFDTSQLTFPKDFYTIQFQFGFPDGIKTVSFATNKSDGIYYIDAVVPDFSDGLAHWVVARFYKDWDYLLLSDAGYEGR